jgi:PelA/Pel-15E family pectate lyase
MKPVMRTAMLALLLTVPSAAPAKVIGHVVPAQPLTMAGVASLPPTQRSQWAAYLERSQVRRASERAALAAERARLGSAIATSPPEGSPKSMPLDKAADWYGTQEARTIADNIVSFQTPAGGWGKNQDRATPPRQPGQSYVVVDHPPGPAARDILADDSQWAFVGTIDNGATTTELRFLARVQKALPGPEGAPYRAAFLKGVRYLLDAQFPNGGWPQVYPLQGGYHDALTYNDDALADVVDVLIAAGSGEGDYAFVVPTLASEARAAADKAVSVILASQIVSGGKRTGWGQQHDPLSLAPVGARNFEPASLSSNESATLLRLLMRLPRPAPEVVEAVHDGVAWLQAAAIRDFEWTAAVEGDGRRLAAKPGAGPLWSRFYDIETMRPIFGDRDKTVHDDVNEISAERRNGYSWFGTGPAAAIRDYAAWAAAHPRGSGAG